MHTRSLVAIGAAVLLACAAPRAAAGEFSIRIPGGLHIETCDGDRLLLRISENGRTLKVRSRGHFELNEDETDIQSLVPGGWIEMEERRHGRKTHQIELRGLPGGDIERHYRRGDVREMDAEGRKWLAEALAMLLRNTSFDSQAHVLRVLRRSGVDGALAEIARLDGDDAQRRSYIALLENAPAGEDVARRIATAASAEIGSDHALTELILAIVQKTPADEVARAACVEATRHIGSDHEHSRALQGILTRAPASPALLAAIVTSAGGIGSDHERAETLVALADTHRIDPSFAEAFFDAVSGIGSDYEQKRTLRSVLARHGTEPHVAAGAARCASRIGSDHERGEVLRTIADVSAIDAALAPAFFQATKGIGSDHEQSQVLLAALHRELDPQVALALVQCAADIGSDSKKAEVLMEVVRTQKLDIELRASVLEAARDIGSDSQRNRVLELLNEQRS